MKIASVRGITPVSMGSVDHTERELAELIIKARGQEFAHDPGISLAARDAAELAHGSGASLVAVVAHPEADPGVLVGLTMVAEAPVSPDELRLFLEDSGPDLREVTEARTDRGYPVVIAERILLDGPLRTGPLVGCQLQAVVLDPGGRSLAVFTLHSITGKGWLELAGLLGSLLSTVDFTG